MIPLPSIDTLLSLPALSLFLLPSIYSYTSIGTSLNLLFFYFAWGSIVFSHDALYVEFFGTLAVRLLFYIVPSAIFLLFDLAVPSLASSIKVHKRAALPSRAGSIRNGQRLAQYVGVSLSNVLLGIAIQIGIEVLLTRVFHVRSALRITVWLPNPLSLVKDITRAYLVRGPLAYYMHKHLLHSRATSPTLTRLHARWQHSLRTTLPGAASYDHPVCYILVRWLPVYLPAVLWRFHVLTYLLFLTLVSLEECLVYSGYALLPSTVMLSGMARRTESHFMRGGGNYGPWGLMDWVHGTAAGGPDFVDDVQEEWEKRDVEGKVKRGANRVVRSASNALDDGNDDGYRDEQAQSGERDDSGDRSASGSGGSRSRKTRGRNNGNGDGPLAKIRVRKRSSK